MEIKEYQGELLNTITYKESIKILWPAMSLNQTAHNLGEVVRDIYQNNNGISDIQLIKLKEEMTKVLWCLAVLANDTGVNLDELAQDNLKVSKEIYDTFVSKN